MILAALESLDWSASIGGHHCTGTIHHPDGSHELIRKLSRKEAKQLAHDDDSRFWPKDTNRFESMADLEKAALAWCEENLGPVWLLLNYDILNPNHVIGGKGYAKQRLEKIEAYQKWWWSQSDSTRERIWSRGYKKWNRLIKPA